MHPHLHAEKHIDVLVFRIVPVPSCPQPRWEKWTALADNEDQARAVVLYHFPGHLSAVVSFNEAAVNAPRKFSM
jgi:hypothetical protein